MPLGRWPWGIVYLTIAMRRRLRSALGGGYNGPVVRTTNHCPVLPGPERRIMSEQNGPYGRAAVAQNYANKDGEPKLRWFTVGTVWENRDGSLRVVLDAIPIQWLNGSAKQAELVVFKSDAPTGNNGRRK